jgi:hypothetical protein
LLGHSFITGLSLSEDLGATFRRIGAVPPTADIGIDNPARANVETTPARDGHRIAACIASRSDLPEPIWLRTSANLGQTWGSPVPVPGIRSRDRGAFSERQIALAVHGDRIAIAGLAKDGRDWILTVIQATATGAAITMPDPPRQLRIPGLSWTSLGLWSDDRGAVVILAWEGLTLVPVMDGRPLTPHRIVAGHRVDGIDLLRLPGDRFAAVWSDDRHGHPVGFPSPLSDRPRSDHEDVHAASLGGNGSVRSVQISTTGSHSHSPVLGRVGDRSVVVWVEHQLRASRNETGARGAPIAIRMRSLHD